MSDGIRQDRPVPGTAAFRSHAGPGRGASEPPGAPRTDLPLGAAAHPSQALAPEPGAVATRTHREASPLTPAEATLWHFTCAHGLAGIGSRGLLKPNGHPFMPELGPICWLTSDPSPAADDVGLTRAIIRCDRLAHRYRVVSSNARPWAAVRELAPSVVVADLERYADPSTWWVATRAEVVLA